MVRRENDLPQKAAMCEMMQEYLKENDISIKSENDINSIMRDMMFVLLAGEFLMRNRSIPNMITATKKPITAEVCIPEK